MPLIFGQCLGGVDGILLALIGETCRWKEPEKHERQIKKSWLLLMSFAARI
jgi:hypothetical protein